MFKAGIRHKTIPMQSWYSPRKKLLAKMEFARKIKQLLFKAGIRQEKNISKDSKLAFYKQNFL
jgi:putative SOS response-associated peptidase YedK